MLIESIEWVQAADLISQKRVVFAEPFFASADEKADKYKIVQFFKQFKGYIPEYGITEDLEN